MDGAQRPGGIVRLKAADLNIPERDCCGEAVEGALIPLIAEENKLLRNPCQAEGAFDSAKKFA
jgi:hypothetical protein